MILTVFETRWMLTCTLGLDFSLGLKLAALSQYGVHN